MDNFAHYKLLAKGKSPFCDFFATKQAFYIINWQRGQYIRTSDLETAADLKGPYMISKGCMNGKYACAASEQSIYIIDTSNQKMHRTSNISKDSDSMVLPLNPKVQDIKGVCAADTQLFYVIIGNQYIQTQNLTLYSVPTHVLNSDCQDGDYYLANYPGNFYIVYGTHVHQTSDLSQNTDPYDFALHPKLIEFMPLTDFSGDWFCIQEHYYDNYKTWSKVGVNKKLSDSFRTTSSDPTQQPSFENVLRTFHVDVKYYKELTKQYHDAQPSPDIFTNIQEMRISLNFSQSLWQWIYTAKNAAGEVQTLYTQWFKKAYDEKPK